MTSIRDESPVRKQLRPQIQVLNVEKEEQRFPARNDSFGPTVATWRNNLAALSQRWNLLFVAHGKEVYVWVPRGPHQVLGSHPPIILCPEMFFKEPSADGYIDPLNPHTINNILVDDLGLDEVLLLATDSGNVCGYNVEAIFKSLPSEAKTGYEDPFRGAELTPFFSEWVGRSAWGLATHKFARLIAVSSNTCNITVFAFALVDSTSGNDATLSSLQVDEGQTWVPIDSRPQLRELRKLMPDNHRSRNLRLTYRGHFDNIPFVSFANFDLDPNGLWMVSTDINNKTIVWRIWDELSPIRLYFPGDPLNKPPQRGWSVIPLDPRTFRRHESIEQACGCQPEQVRMAGRTVLDVTKAARDIPDSSQIFLFGADKQEPAKPIRLPDDIFSPDCCVSQRGLRPSSVHQNLPNTQASDHVSENESHPLSNVNSQATPGQSSSRQVLHAGHVQPDLFLEDNEHVRVPPCLGPSDEDETAEFFRNVDLLGQRPHHPVNPEFFPVIHFSEHHISLAPYPTDSDLQMLSRAPLQQRSFHAGISRFCDRFNMVKYLPELGLVVAASQKGRVAIISLTWQEKIGYAFRVDWIVPFYTQERNDDRPLLPLLGMAVSPMPGFEVPPDVPVIPQDVDPDDWLEFKYRILHPDPKDASPFSFSDSSHASPPPVSPTKPPSSVEDPTAAFEPESASIPSLCSLDSHSESRSLPDSEPPSLDDHNPLNTPGGDRKPTLPELHAKASLAYHPRERWHGWHPSRHYRLLLIFCNHTVMSYEFWHDWNT